MGGGLVGLRHGSASGKLRMAMKGGGWDKIAFVVLASQRCH